jgi:chemotaxis protein MotA
MAKMADEEHAYQQSVKVLLLAFIKGTAPIQAIEFGRRAIPMRLRPSFQEVEEACKALKNAGAAAAAVEAAAGAE